MASWDSDPIIAPAQQRPKAATGGAAPWENDPIVAPQGAKGDGFVEQALSGINEGIANTVGFVPDTINNLVVKPAVAGINAVTGSDIASPEKPFLGTKMMRELMAPTITAETDDPAKQAVRRIAQELPATLIPGAGFAAKAAKPLQMLGADVAAALGSGAGAAAAEQLAPDNPYAEAAASLLGGFTPMGVSAALRRGATKLAAPTADALQEMKRVAYQKADSLGVSYTPKGIADLGTSVAAAAKAGNINPVRHPKAVSMVAEIQSMATKPMSLTELDQLRQVVRRDLIKSSDEAEQHFGDIILDQIDDFIAKAGPGQVASGSGADGAKAIQEARALNTRWRKTETIEDALYRANLNASSSGSGGNLNNTLRQAFKSILLNDRRRAAFSAEEITMMENIVKQGMGEDALRLLGKLSPSGNGLAAWGGLLAASQGFGAIPATGLVAKMLADRGTVSKAAKLRADVARGGPAPAAPVLTKDDAAVAQALLMGQAANQNEPKAVSAALLRPRALN